MHGGEECLLCKVEGCTEKLTPNLRDLSNYCLKEHDPVKQARDKCKESCNLDHKISW